MSQPQLPTCRFEDFEAFLKALQALGCTAVVQRHIREVRPAPEGQSGITVGLVDQVTYLAYQGGQLLICQRPGVELTACRDRLKELGLELRAVSDNIT